MTIKILQQEMIKAMKDGNSGRKKVLTNAIGAIKNAAIADKCKDNIPEELVDRVLLKEMKTIREMIDTCPDNRKDLLEDYQMQLSVIKEFAPSLITDKNEITKLVCRICEDQVFPNKGAAMKTLMPKLKGKVDMKLANQVISEILDPFFRGK